MILTELELETVAIVCDENFGGDLVKLARTREVWAIQSEVNDPVAQQLWDDEQPGDDNRYVITTFVTVDGETREDMFVRILPTVDGHHNDYCEMPTWSRLEIYGVKLSSIVKNALKPYDVKTYEVTDYGFVCQR